MFKHLVFDLGNKLPSALHEMVHLIHSSPDDVETRSMTVATEVVSLWQRMAATMPVHPPGLILLNATGISPDPLAELASLSDGMGTGDPPTYREGDDSARVGLRTMRRIYCTYLQIPEDRAASRDHHARTHRLLWNDSKIARFGPYPAGPYSDRWDEHLQLVGGEHGFVRLWLLTEQDRRLFQQHALLDPGKILDPWGVNNHLQVSRVNAAVVGTLTPEQLEDKLVGAITENGLPMLILPHASRKPGQFNRYFHLCMMTQNLPSNDPLASIDLDRELQAHCRSLRWAWLREYESILRPLRQHLPLTYESFLLKTLSELPFVCIRICMMLGMSSDSLGDTVHDLHAHTVRAIVTGVASLGYYGWFMETGYSHKETAKLLSAVRSADGRSQRELQRKMRINADELKRVLAILNHHGLVKTTDSRVTAVGLEEFISRIPVRLAFPRVELQTGKLFGAIMEQAAELSSARV